jgi:SAM-dependent methyltransferase
MVDPRRHDSQSAPNDAEMVTLRELRHYYECVYYGNEQVIQAPTHHFRRLAARLPILPGQRVLDVACGSGEWLVSVRNAGAFPVGLDLSEKAVAVCKRALPGGVFCAGVAERLPYADDRFDVVSCLGALEHFLRPELALEEMIRVARRGATFLFLVPNSGFLTRRVGLFQGTHQTDIREEVRSLSEWKELFASAGLTVTKQWRDLHVVSWSWIKRGAWYEIPLRAAQAAALTLWPISWQYQVYHLCKRCAD